MGHVTILCRDITDINYKANRDKAVATGESLISLCFAAKLISCSTSPQISMPLWYFGCLLPKYGLLMALSAA